MLAIDIVATCLAGAIGFVFSLVFLIDDIFKWQTRVFGPMATLAIIAMIIVAIWT